MPGAVFWRLGRMVDHQLAEEQAGIVRFNPDSPEFGKNASRRIVRRIEFVALGKGHEGFDGAVGFQGDLGLVEEIVGARLPDLMPGARPGDRLVADRISDRSQEAECAQGCRQ